MPFFSDVDWDNLLEIEPLFVPQPDDDMDTTYFKRKETLLHLVPFLETNMLCTLTVKRVCYGLYLFLGTQWSHTEETS